jgi:serine/threonine protein kinase
VAIKRIALKNNGRWADKEIKIQKKIMTIDHTNVLHTKKTLLTKDHLFVINEFCLDGTLFDFLRGGSISELAKSILKQLINGVQKLLSVGIVHCDIKPENIFRSNSIYKLGDFGLCEQVDDYEFSLLKGFGGSISYLAPEVQLCQPHTSLRDVWSVGIVFYEMMFGISSFWNGSDDMSEAIRRARVQIASSTISSDSTNFLLRSLEMNPKIRMNWREVFNHPIIFYTNFPVEIKNKMEIEETDVIEKNPSFVEENAVYIAPNTLNTYNEPAPRENFSPFFRAVEMTPINYAFEPFTPYQLPFLNQRHISPYLRASFNRTNRADLSKSQRSPNMPTPSPTYRRAASPIPQKNKFPNFPPKKNPFYFY